MFGGVDLESKTWGDYAFAFRDDNILSSEARGYGKIFCCSMFVKDGMSTGRYSSKRGEE